MNSASWHWPQVFMVETGLLCSKTLFPSRSMSGKVGCIDEDVWVGAKSDVATTALIPNVSETITSPVMISMLPLFISSSFYGLRNTKYAFLRALRLRGARRHSAQCEILRPPHSIGSP